MKKKLLALVLCICLVGGLLAGCATDDTNYCLGDWKLSDGSGAEDSAIKTETTVLLEKMGLALEDIMVLSINEDGTVQQYFLGALIEGTWTKKSGVKCRIDYTVGEETYGGTLNYNDGLLSYEADDGSVLYFEKTSRNAKAMSDAFNAQYAGDDPQKAFLEKASDSATAAAALLIVQQIQSGTEAAIDELLTTLGQYYYTLPTTQQEQIKYYINEYKSAIGE